MLCCFDPCKCSCSVPGSFLGTHALHFMAYFQGEHLDRGRYLGVCLVNKGERLVFGLRGRVWCLWYLRRRDCGEFQSLSVHTSGESCIVRGSCFSGGVFEPFHALCWLCWALPLSGGTSFAHAWLCWACLFLEGSSMFWSQCVEPLPLSWGLTLLALLSSSDPFWLSFAFDHLS